jgi:hypothetical protein
MRLLCFKRLQRIIGAVLVETTKQECRHCSKRFPTRKSKKFCSGSCRFLYWHYAKHKIKPRLCCAYCGQIADTEDHVPPRSARPYLLAANIAHSFLSVAACRECNNLLSYLPYWTVSDRRAYIKKRLAQKYKRLLAIPGWSDSELKELGPSLQLDVIVGIVQRNVVRARLLWDGEVQLWKK